MREQLAGMEFVTVHDCGGQQCGIVTFSVNGIDSGLVKSKLAEEDINVSVGKAVSTLLYMNKKELSNIVRASVHYYNTEAEIKTFCQALKAIAGHSVIFTA
jgi:selenocysteine lyase/cysteine desulfurase